MKTTLFDVLIVYSEKMAESSSTVSATVPFDPKKGDELCNLAYQYFMKVCKKNNLSVAFTTSADVIGAGLCESYWLMENNNWKKVIARGYSELIFDKISPGTKKIASHRNLLFSSELIRSINSSYIHKLFFDKQHTFTKLKGLAIPTVVIENASLKAIKKAFTSLTELIKTYPHQADFSSQIILKDRFGACGNNIYKFAQGDGKDIQAIMQKNEKKSFVIQPFTKFDKGYLFNETLVSADIRLVYLKGKIVQTYVRMAEKGNFLCNAHQGGSISYITQNDVPKSVMIQAKKIMKLLKDNLTFFSLDFMVSNNGNAYLIEGNTGPGINWDPMDIQDMKNSKGLIRIIVEELTEMIARSKIIQQRNVAKILEITPVMELPLLPVSHSILIA